MAVLVLGTTLAVANVDGAFDRPFDPRFWCVRLLNAALAVYWLVAPTLATRSHERVVASLSRVILGSSEFQGVCAHSRMAAFRLGNRAFLYVASSWERS